MTGPFVIRFVFDDEDHSDGITMYGAVANGGICWAAHPDDAKKFDTREQAEAFLQNGYGATRELATVVPLGEAS